MSNLEITGASSTYPEISTGSKGLIKEFQNNIALSYRKWKRRYREIEHSRRYALGKTTWRSQTITPGQANQEAGKIIKSNHLDEPFLSKPKPGIIVKIKIAKKSKNINGDHLFNVFNSKKDRTRKTITPNSK